MKSSQGFEAALRWAKSLGFGGTAGACLGLLLRHYLPDSTLTEKQAMYIGAAQGGVLHRILDFLVDWVLRPLSTYSSFYAKLVQLQILKGVLPAEQRKQIVRELARKHFLGK